jgi:maleate cis-trans isomerase
MVKPVRIAVLFPSTGLIDGELCDMAEERGAEALIYKVAPSAVASADDPVAVSGMTQEMGAPELLARVAATARDASPDVVVWACTSGSFLVEGGSGAAQASAMSQAAGGVPASTTSLAMLESLRRRSARHVAVVTPYHEAIGKKFVEFLLSNGFEIDGDAHAGCGSDAEVGELTLERLEPLVRAAVGRQSEAIAIPCTAVRRQTLVADLESKFGVPVILANDATLDHAVIIARNAR